MSKVKEDKSRVTLEVDGKQAINQLGKLEMQPISFYIADSSLNTKRRVEFEGISAQSEQDGYAQIVWKIWQFDQEGTLHNELDAVQDRIYQYFQSQSGNPRGNLDHSGSFSRGGSWRPGLSDGYEFRP